MEIGPIAGIRPIPMIKPSSPSPDLAGVFGVELRRQTHGDAPSPQRAARGLEDEETENDASCPEDEGTRNETAHEAQPHSNVSFFA